jgi:hypothetical protein
MLRNPDLSRTHRYLETFSFGEAMGWIEIIQGQPKGMKPTNWLHPHSDWL